MRSSFLHFGDSGYEVWNQMRVTPGEQLATEPPVLYILVISLLASTVTRLLEFCPEHLYLSRLLPFPCFLIPFLTPHSLLLPLWPPSSLSKVKLYFPCIVMQSNFVFHPLLVSGASKTFLLRNAFTTQASTPDPTLSAEQDGQRLCNFRFPFFFTRIWEGREKKRCIAQLLIWIMPSFPSILPLRRQQWTRREKKKNKKAAIARLRFSFKLIFSSDFFNFLCSRIWTW